MLENWGIEQYIEDSILGDNSQAEAARIYDGNDFDQNDSIPFNLHTPRTTLDYGSLNSLLNGSLSKEQEVGVLTARNKDELMPIIAEDFTQADSSSTPGTKQKH